jgi:hypothetical protein
MPTLATVIPLRPTSPAPPLPEPRQLYGLIQLAFQLHQPEGTGICAACREVWPCQQIRLAFRLREGF